MVLELKRCLFKESGFYVLKKLKILLSNLSINTVDLQTQIILDIKKRQFVLREGSRLAEVEHESVIQSRDFLGGHFNSQLKLNSQAGTKG